LWILDVVYLKRSSCGDVDCFPDVENGVGLVFDPGHKRDRGEWRHDGGVKMDRAVKQMKRKSKTR
jgi:hypothetical protein